MYFSFKAGRGLPKINVAGGALVSFNLRSSFLGRPQGQKIFFLNSGAKAKARALIKRLKAGIGAEGKGQGQVPPPSLPLPRQRRDFNGLYSSSSLLLPAASAARFFKFEPFKFPVAEDWFRAGASKV